MSPERLGGNLKTVRITILSADSWGFEPMILKLILMLIYLYITLPMIVLLTLTTMVISTLIMAHWTSGCLAIIRNAFNINDYG